MTDNSKSIGAKSEQTHHGEQTYNGVVAPINVLHPNYRTNELTAVACSPRSEILNYKSQELTK